MWKRNREHDSRERGKERNRKLGGGEVCWCGGFAGGGGGGGGGGVC